MSDAQKLIEETLLAAIKDQAWTCDSVGVLVVDGDLSVKELAVRVDKALGGLGPIYATGGSGKKLVAWTSYGWDTVTE
ncbi:hypothetical protein [Mycobacteroides abscessus]